MTGPKLPEFLATFFILISRIPRIYIQSNGPKELHFVTQQDYLVRNKISQRCTQWPCSLTKIALKYVFFCTDFQKFGVFCDQQDESYHLRTKTDQFREFWFFHFSAILFHNITCKNCHKGSNSWRPFQIGFLYPIDC